ncbi:MAG TPA: hypothetical protein HPP58_04355 [Deltaproteobacteria bacterium]|nr:hypothetical protein [Deltaproteobacteria bacterium]
MVKALFFFFVFLIQLLPLHPVFAQKAPPLPVNMYDRRVMDEPFFHSLVKLEKQRPEISDEIRTRIQKLETLASAEEGSDSDSGSETVTGEDDTDADTNRDSDDDADRGNSSLTPAEQ